MRHLPESCAPVPVCVAVCVAVCDGVGVPVPVRVPVPVCVGVCVGVTVDEGVGPELGVIEPVPVLDAAHGCGEWCRGGSKQPQRCRSSNARVGVLDAVWLGVGVPVPVREAVLDAVPVGVCVPVPVPLGVRVPVWDGVPVSAHGSHGVVCATR
jgi:hypothetical protein